MHRRPEDELQVLDVVFCDLIERAVIRCEIVAANHQPVARIGFAQHRVRNGDEVLHLAGYGKSGNSRCGIRRRRAASASSRLTASSAGRASRGLRLSGGRRWRLLSATINTLKTRFQPATTSFVFVDSAFVLLFQEPAHQWPFGAPSL